MMTRHIVCLALVLVLPGLSACSSHQLSGSPEPSSNIEEDIKAIETYYGQATALDRVLNTESEVERNKFITGRLVVMNLRYLRFVRDVTADKQVIDSASDILILSLNLAGTAVGGASAKTVLAAISAGVAGSRVTIDKNFFYEKTMPALVAAMNAERRKSMVPLLKGMKLSVVDYPVAQAVTDLDAYYHAGTLIGAVNAVTAEAGVQEAAADAEIEALQDLQNARSRAFAWIQQNDAAAARTKIVAWYEAIPDALLKFKAAALILDVSVRALPSATVADALVDQTQRQAVIDILDSNTLDPTGKVIATLGPASTAFKVPRLIGALEPGALSELLGSQLLKDKNLLGLK